METGSTTRLESQQRLSKYPGSIASNWHFCLTDIKVALRRIEWVNSYLFEHTGQDF